MRKERAGEYSGGSRYQFERRAFLGGVVYFWVKRGLRAGLYRNVGKLLASGAPMIAAGFANRVFARLRKLRPVEAVNLPMLRRTPSPIVQDGLETAGAKTNSYLR